MKKFFYYLDIYMFNIYIYFKSFSQYRVDFIIGILSVVMQASIGLIFINVIYNNIPVIEGWSYNELLLMFGFSSCGIALFIIFFSEIWMIGPKYVARGELTILLTKPLSPLFQIVSQRVKLENMFQFLLGIGAVIYALDGANKLDPINLLQMLIMVIVSLLVFFSLNLFFATFSFWTINSNNIVFAVYALREYGRYPIQMFPKILQVVLIFIFPFAFTAFYPSIAILSSSLFILLVSIFASGLLTICAIKFWRFGLKHFESAGA
ncbi:hypothetical protein FZX01_03685 [Listeria monocytogenes]|uniref:ABC transporter permease n=1 Tax=Listeria monocytogenes TaxID=1639 RepID=UPI0011EB95D0|nr:ABC-2 family transporter protein [Listeria monocytogenes]EHY0679235.1 ABC-2 family transporter protein [Listeria monocytogenes]TYU88624.1 hypothetical protein FZX01_03685 [Listeria monocytogenes]